MKSIRKSFRRRSGSIRERLSPLRRRPSQSHQAEASWRETGEPKLLLTADMLYFDPTIFQQFKEEGFDVAYIPHATPPKQYQEQLQRFADVLEERDRYAIVAYGESAAVVLEACTAAMPRLCAVVTYYPTSVPNANCAYPPSLNYQIHLAESQPFAAKLNCYTYHRSQVGFAEQDSQFYDRVGATLAWSRTIGCLRKGFDLTVDLAPAWERHLMAKYDKKDLEGTIESLAGDAYVNYVPVMTGGIGSDDLRHFYSEYFIPRNPSSLDIQLISRTMGIDHVVDELYLSFRHTQEMPWILPGVPATDKFVEVAIVSIVGVRAGKLRHENVYWDQASVLAQIGLLDTRYIPPAFQTIDEGSKLKRLPVLGAESAQKVLNPESEESNRLIIDG
ncbi:hypothetical protein LOZ53_001542 [Ophidiomyces ophidiicola]|nr:hypothetical protein LOZ55_003456 [Ophidiomyces ophidiicola]KAI1991172.1 hypothetical protein LOZ51_004704 [Ophidiomyces ophidiicola]KAI1994098.1 hypothetical protein LOZ54_001116 [Ophidiomyces ophidiicola]KAI1995141.1 hypothetical protein LOZ53_001542 [Ophidiomyces ophidiicola]